MYFITVGTHPAPFARLLEAVKMLPELTMKSVFYQGFMPKEKLFDFKHESLLTREEFFEYLAEADLVITHAGIGSIYESFTAGKKTIVIPRLAQFGEHANNHQLEIVEQLRSAPLPNIYILEDLSRLNETICEVQNAPLIDVSSFRLGESLKSEIELVLRGWIK